MNHNEMIAVITAHRDGKKIEARFKTDKQWFLCHVPPVWGFNEYDYRIAVEPRRCWVCWNDRSQPVVMEYSGEKSINGCQLVVEEIK